MAAPRYADSHAALQLPLATQVLPNQPPSRRLGIARTVVHNVDECNC